MTKLHELLAAEKTPNAAWNQVFEETLKKFKNPSNYFEGYSRNLSMIEDSAANSAIEDQAREEKPVTTTVADTLEFALRIFGKAEDLQFQKNSTNRIATANVMWKGALLFDDIPVDELLGLEARLAKIRSLYATMPTLDNTKHWERNVQIGGDIFETTGSQVTTKTEKTIVPVIMSPATDKHPAQVQATNKDVVVGKFSVTQRSGAATSEQKARALEIIDDLLVEIKQARMRANETEVVAGKISETLVELLLRPFTQ